MNQNLGKGLGLATVALGIDQASKWWIADVVMQPPQSIPVLPFFNIVLAYNRGVSFGMFAAGSDAGRWMLIGVTGVITLFMIHWLYNATNGLKILALGLIIGGACGNIVDRMTIGAVIDFLDFYAFGYHWPAFNMADTFIFSGAALLIVESLFIQDDLA